MPIPTVRPTISNHNGINILCAILEPSSTISELVDKVGFPTMRRTIPELSKFQHCVEHIYSIHVTPDALVFQSTEKLQTHSR